MPRKRQHGMCRLVVLEHAALPNVDRSPRPLGFGWYIGSGQGRDRTADTRIFSPVLYQLSYLSDSLHNRENWPTVNGSGEARCVGGLGKLAAGCAVGTRGYPRFLW
jgi:hypothetical protein